MNVSHSFVAVVRGEKQKTVVALDSRPLAIDKGKSIIGDPSLVLQNPMKHYVMRRKGTRKYCQRGNR